MKMNSNSQAMLARQASLGPGLEPIESMTRLITDVKPMVEGWSA